MQLNSSKKWVEKKGGDRSIRQELEKLTCNVLQQDRADSISKICGYNIAIISDESPYSRPIFNEPLMNAYAYATGLYKSERYLEHRLNTKYEQSPTTFTSPNFILFLTEGDFIKEIDPSTNNECMVIYYDYNRPLHAGVVNKSGKVRSKWGTWPIFEHDLWLVPASYGNDIKYYNLLSLPEAEKCFFAFADKVRLSPETIEVIKNLFCKHFFESDNLWLFGSRVDMYKKGGDIDLYIESSCSDPDAIWNAKSDFLLALWRTLGEQKIDIVIKDENKDLPIYEIAKKTGVKLL